MTGPDYADVFPWSRSPANRRLWPSLKPSFACRFFWLVIIAFAVVQATLNVIEAQNAGVADFWKLAKVAAVGAVTGGVTAGVGAANPFAGIFVAGLMGGINNAANQKITGGRVDWERAGIAALSATVTAGAGYGITRGSTTLILQTSQGVWTAGAAGTAAGTLWGFNIDSGMPGCYAYEDGQPACTSNATLNTRH